MLNRPLKRGRQREKNQCEDEKRARYRGIAPSRFP
jgi:hypothetical protein